MTGPSTARDSSMPRPRPAPAAAGPVARARPRTTAQGIIATLALPGPALPGAMRPLPVPDLHRLPRDASMAYDIGSVDASGRLASQPVIAAAGWQPGERLELITVADAIVLRASPDGAAAVVRRAGIFLPAQARQRHGIKPGDRLLLAAAREHAIVIAYPASAIDEMIAAYHAARIQGDEHE